MNRPDASRLPPSPREARRKLLLLQAQLHRLELQQARQDCRSALRGGALRSTVPGLLAVLLRHRAGGLLASALPLLLRSGAVGRWARRAMLVAGSGAAALGIFSRWRQRESSSAPTAADKKNPGRSRD